MIPEPNFRWNGRAASTVPSLSTLWPAVHQDVRCHRMLDTLRNVLQYHLRLSGNLASLLRQFYWTLKVGFSVGVLLVGASAVRAMEVTVVGNAVILSSPVVGDELDKVKNAFVQNPAVSLAVLRNSWGGHAPTGYRVGELFRDKGITTAVSGYCVSSCSRMFLGGRQRMFTDDYPPSQTFVGFHGHYDSAGKLNVQSVRANDLYRWILKYSDGRPMRR